MRVAVYHCLPLGGAKRMLEEILARTGDRAEVEVFELDLGPDSYLRDPAGAAKPPHRVPVAAARPTGPLKPAFDVGRVVAAEARVADLIDTGGFDLVFVNPSRFTQAPTLLYRLATPTVYMIQEPRRRSHESGYRTTIDPRLTGLRVVPRKVATALFDRVVGEIDRRAVAAAGTLVCNSYFSAESVARAYGREPRVCHLGVDAGRFSPAPPALGAKAGDVSDDRRRHPYVVSVGALDPSKGHDLILDALSLLDTADRPALHVVYERSAPGFDLVLHARAGTAGVDLTLHAGVADDDLVELYRGAAATVCAARLEPFGLTPLESIACGTPVVALREGGYRETVTDGVNGELVERRPDALARAISQVVSRHYDPDDLRASVVPAWDWDHTVDRLLAIFEEAAAAGGLQGR